MTKYWSLGMTSDAASQTNSLAKRNGRGSREVQEIEFLSAIRYPQSELEFK